MGKAGVVKPTMATTTAKGLTGLNTLLGVWLFVSPFIFQTTAGGAWNLFIVGAAIAILAGYNWARTSQGRVPSSGVSSVNAVLGLWMALSPFVFLYGVALSWNVVITGLLVLAFAGYVAYEASRQPMPLGR